MSNRPFILDADELEFHSGEECRRWLESLPLTNIVAAHAALTSQIKLACHAALAPIELLKILETVREPVDYVQTEFARSYAGKPIPLDVAQTEAWNNVCTLWNRVGEAYAACREAQMGGAPALKHFGPLIVMRCLGYCARLMFEHYRIYRHIPAARWWVLHQFYSCAESAGYAEDGIVDVFDGKDIQSSCATEYCRALLGHLANPYSLSKRQMEFLARWLDKWSRLAHIRTEPMPESATRPLTVDLAGVSGAQVAEQPQPLRNGPSLRYLDLQALARTLLQVMVLLKQGQTPAQLGLGDDARQPGCGSFLMLLHLQWCRAGTSRCEPRGPTKETVDVGVGLRAAHFHISGRAFRPPDSSISHLEAQDIQLFGHISERTKRILATQESCAIESWQMVNQSPSGFLSVVQERNVQLRLSHNQLVAAQRGPGRLFNVGTVQWLRQEDSNLLAGIRLFPGIPRAVAVRPANFIPAGNRGFERALLLPAVSAPATAASLILPLGWHGIGRLVELHLDGTRVARMLNLLERGSDFDRCTLNIT